MTTNTAVKIDSLCKSFRSRDHQTPMLAVDQVSFTIETGEFICLLGPSGCGKTTVLRCLAGFEHPSSGKIFVFNKDITNLAPNKRDIPLVFQNYALFPHMTVFDNVAFGLKMQKKPKSEIVERVTHILQKMQIAHLAKRFPEQMSGGQQQRVALARALVVNPRLILFDEPLCNLDAKLRIDMRFEIKKIQREFGITCIYVTHDQEEAMSLADRIAVMNHGKIEQIGTPQQIYAHPKNRFVADFIGKANFLPVTVRAVQKEWCEVDLFGITCKAAWPEGNTPPTPGRAMTLMVRYESIRPDPQGQWQGTVTQILYLGERVIYEIFVGSQTVYMQIENPQAHGILSIQQKINLDFIENSLVVLDEPQNP